MLQTATAGLRSGGFTSIEREWEGETAFLIAGGPSVNSQNVEALRGRRVIVVNSSVYLVPWADILFFGDYETWGDTNRAAVKSFAGRVLSSAYGDVHCDYIEFLRRPSPKNCPPGLSQNPSEAWMRHTSARGAINILCHLGVRTIVGLGLDGGPNATGKTHHHAPHSHSTNPKVWGWQREELGHVATALKDRGVDMVNASPGSKLPFWPIVGLKDYL